MIEMTEPMVEELAKFETKEYKVCLTRLQNFGGEVIYQIQETVGSRPTMCSSYENPYRAVLLFNDLVLFRMQALIQEWEKK